MKKGDINEKLNVLDPKFRREVENMFGSINESISMLYDKATMDEKTGVYNNKFFQTIFHMEIEKAKRHYQELCLFLLDIDHFKKINDTYGHIKADDLLERLGKILRESTRDSDIVARFGGEEFVILLPETGIEEAKEVTSRIRKAIKKDVLLKKHKLTVSGGLTEFRSKDNEKKMLKRADKALYDAKEGGRDRFVYLKSKKGESYEEGKLNEKVRKIKYKQIKKLNKTQVLNEFKKIYHG